jgi:hypothetical protein
LPLRFEENVGQTDSRVRFLARGGGYTMFLTVGETVLSLRAPVQPSTPESSPTARTGAVLRMRLAGANIDADVVGEDELPGRTNYFIGDDPSRWHTDVPSYARVRYHDVAPGVDVVYYGRQGQLEYDFVVAPWADPRSITLTFDGADRVEVGANGDLVLHTAAGEVRQHAPILYQETGQGRVNVAGGYELRGGCAVGFGLASYDPSAPLVIDPVLVYSTYLGGGGSESGSQKVAVDSSGSAYVVGSTDSTDFPTAGAFDSTANGGTDAYVTKLNAAGNGIVYSTYLGGSTTDGGSGIAVAVDAAGAAYITGLTESSNFPTVNAFDVTRGGTFDAFVTKLNPAGNMLVYSSYIGGSAIDRGTGIAVDSLGAAYVNGYTFSADFPSVNAYDMTLGGSQDAFVTKVSAAGNTVVYSTLLGGSGNEVGYGIAVDIAGAAYVLGMTPSADFPTANAYDTTRGGTSDLFVTKLAEAGNTLVFSTYLGGSSAEGSGVFGSIAVDSAGAAYVTSMTTSSDFPTSNAYDTTFGGSNDAIVTKLTPAGNALVYSTYLGGTGGEFGFGLAVDSAGAAYVVGFTSSTAFPTVDAYDTTLGGTSDGFVTKLSASGDTLTYSTYFGGSGSETGFGAGIAIDSTGAAYITGYTSSADLPTANAYDATLGGTTDGFVAKFAGSGPGTDTAGIYIPSTGAWFLRNQNSPGPADLVFSYGPSGLGWVGLAGDWDGDGDDTPGLYDPSNGFFFLRNANTPGPADVVFGFGPGGLGWKPIAGDWDGDGDDTIGLYDPSNGFFFLRQQNAPGPADTFFGFGPGGLGWAPVVGDWDGDGDTTVGLYDPSNGFFFLRQQNAPGSADTFFGFGPGGLGWVPIVGDWDGDGDTTVGLYDPTNGFFFLRQQNAPGSADVVFGYGPANASPLAGDWDGQ